MLPAPARLVRVLALLAALTMLAACNEEGGPLRSPAAKVNGVDITDAQVRLDIALYGFIGRLQGVPCGSPEEGEDADDACARFVLGGLVQQELARAFAGEHGGIAVTEEDVESAVGPFAESIGGEETMLQELEMDGLTRTDLEGLARRLVRLSKVQESLGADLTEEDLLATYDERLIEFAQFHAAHILLATEAEAAEIAAQATPENFEQLAREHSIDPSAQENGGDLGPAPASQFVEDFSRAALALEPGGISDPVESDFGWHVIHLIGKVVPPLEDVEDQLRQGAAQEAFQDWLEGALSESDIEVNPRYGRFEVETGEVVPVTATSPTAEETTPGSEPTS